MTGKYRLGRPDHTTIRTRGYSASSARATARNLRAKAAKTDDEQEKARLLALAERYESAASADDRAVIDASLPMTRV